MSKYPACSDQLWLACEGPHPRHSEYCKQCRIDQEKCGFDIDTPSTPSHSTGNLYDAAEYGMSTPSSAPKLAKLDLPPYAKTAASRRVDQNDDTQQDIASSTPRRPQMPGLLLLPILLDDRRVHVAM